MPSRLDRRRFLQGSAVLGGSLLIGGIPRNRAANTVPVRIDAPVIDELTVREITDNTHDIFLRGAELPGLVVQRTGFPEAPEGKTLFPRQDSG
jgi:7,8-dihydropterin-6-yl-methyl-4-(beta-D-ribofuranosyl)aminobenzene 5'-phosphate synthase